MKKERINWLLILQGWTMLWVVIGHSPLDSVVDMPFYVEVLYKFAYSFHMQLFMLISGYLFFLTRISRDNWTFISTAKDKLIRLGIPFVVFTLFAMVLKTVFSADMERQSTISISEFVKACIYPGDGPLAEMWFVMSLMVMMSLFNVWKLIFKSRLAQVLTLVLVIMLHYKHIPIKEFCISTVCEYLIWFYVGMIIGKYNFIDAMRKYQYGLLFGGVVIYVLGFIHKDIATVGGVLLSIQLSFLIDKVWPKLFFSFRDYTYQIFLMGIFAQIFVKMMYKRLDVPYFLMYIVCILIGLYVPVLVSIITRKINYKPLLLAIGLK